LDAVLKTRCSVVAVSVVVVVVVSWCWTCLRLV